MVRAIMTHETPVEELRPIVAIGEILVEIMADEPGLGFGERLALTGPFASGAPAIFTSQVARLGAPAAIVACVGRDDFGRMNIARLEADGADISAIAVDPELPTGTAFVRYRPNGARDFVFNIRHSASGRVSLDPAARAVLGRAAHLHVMGSSLISPAVVDAVRDAVTTVRAQGGSVSFDPNLRREIIDTPGMREALAWMLRQSDLFLPSGEELTLLTEARDERGAVAEILSVGPRAIVVKHGAAGAAYHDRETTWRIAAFPAREVDPTGAGDCFGAAFVAGRLLGRNAAESLRLAAAAGAHAVEHRGPMEGAAGIAALETVMARAPGNHPVRADRAAT